MRLSVIVPALEEAQALPATLYRVRTAPLHEVIVVDGGSRDATRAVAAPFADRVLTTRPGRGVFLSIAISLGVTWGQGYFFARPEPGFNRPTL